MRERSAVKLELHFGVALGSSASLTGGSPGRSVNLLRTTTVVFITTTLDNGAQLEHAQKAAGAQRPRHDQALRPARVQSREGGQLFCHVLIVRAFIDPMRAPCHGTKPRSVGIATVDRLCIRKSPHATHQSRHRQSAGVARQCPPPDLCYNRVDGRISQRPSKR